MHFLDVLFIVIIIVFIIIPYLKQFAWSVIKIIGGILISFLATSLALRLCSNALENQRFRSIVGLAEKQNSRLDEWILMSQTSFVYELGDIIFPSIQAYITTSSSSSNDEEVVIDKNKNNEQQQENRQQTTTSWNYPQLWNLLVDTIQPIYQSFNNNINNNNKPL